MTPGRSGVGISIRSTARRTGADLVAVVQVSNLDRRRAGRDHFRGSVRNEILAACAGRQMLEPILAPDTKGCPLPGTLGGFGEPLTD